MKNDTFDTGSSTAVNKSKKTRYSLKKLLDRSRFSPRLLRISSLMKATDADQEADEELKSTCFNLDGESGRDLSGGQNAPHCELMFNRQHAASVPLCSQHSCGESNGATPTGTSEDANQTPENFVEEEYEESLTQFADLIIEGLKNNPSLRNQQPQDSSKEPSCGGISQPTPTDALSLNLHGIHSGQLINGQLTPPVKFDAFRSLSSVPLSISGDGCAIYNEPCDAKPDSGHTLDDPVTIYTVTRLNVCSGEGAVQDMPKNSSLHSDAMDRESCALQATNRTSCTPTPAHGRADSDSTFGVRTKPSELKSPSSTVANSVLSPGISSTASPTPGHVGFVDAPRGNSVIVHHPTSPFARVPRGSVPTAIPSVTGSASLALPNTSHDNTPVPFSNLLGGTVAPQDSICSRSASQISANNFPGTNVSWKNAAPTNSSLTTASLVNRTRQNITDTQPTYEEAWDLKMARQLGFGISRLTPVPVITASTETTSIAHSDPRSALVVNPKLNSMDTSTSGSSMRTHVETHSHSGLKFFENRLFDQRPYLPKSKNDTAGFQPVCSGSEYDYAYNGSWSMGVKLNLSLAMNGTPETGETTTASIPTAVRKSGNATMSTVPHRPIISAGPSPLTSVGHMNNSGLVSVPPHMHTHQIQLHGHGMPSGLAPNIASGILPKRFEKLTLSDSVSGFQGSELDNGSTDSDSWETRHGRIVSELTSARFVDPSAVALNEPIPVRPVHSSGQPLSVLTESRPHSSSCQPDSAQMFSSSASQSNNHQAVPGGSGISPTMKQSYTHLESLPLDEQPWFHRSLTRSEAEELLRHQPEGSFLVRTSETSPNDYSLTIKHKTFLHMKISRNPSGQYILGEYSQPYATVPQMIYHYARTLVPVRGAESVTLTHPV